MKNSPKTTSRKKFLFWGSFSLISFSLLNLFGRGKKPKKETIKMLTQDGKLVEVDVASIKRTGNKISDTEIHTWLTTQKNS